MSIYRVLLFYFVGEYMFVTVTLCFDPTDKRIYTRNSLYRDRFFKTIEC